MNITSTLKDTQDKMTDAVGKSQTKVRNTMDNMFGDNPSDLTDLQQKMVDGVRKGTERRPNLAVTAKFSDRLTSSKLLTPSEVVDRSFDFAGKVLENQRSFVSALIDAGTKPELDEEETTETAKNVEDEGTNKDA